jgi:hypothetical protein
VLDIPDDSIIAAPDSHECVRQAQRERTALLVEYFDEGDIPPSADESLIPVYAEQGPAPIEIPFEEPGNATAAAAAAMATNFLGQGGGGNPVDISRLLNQFLMNK